MRRLLLGLASLGTATGAFSAAPDTLADTVFRSYLLFSGVTNAGEDTTIFHANGRFNRLKLARGVVETPHPEEAIPDAHWAAILDPLPDGQYAYTKTGPNTGTVTFMPDGGAAFDTPLYFYPETTGSMSPNGLRGLGGSAFQLTPLQARDNGALSNVALRGRVAPGQSLTMGFTIPAGVEREVLVRVIGPSLSGFGVASAWSRSALQLYRGATPLFGASFRFPYWSETPTGIYFAIASSPERGLRRIFDYVGAFSLPTGSKDTAVVVRLAAGAYTAVVATEPGEAGGEVLIELYPLP